MEDDVRGSAEKFDYTKRVIRKPGEGLKEGIFNDPDALPEGYKLNPPWFEIYVRLRNEYLGDDLQKKIPKDKIPELKEKARQLYEAGKNQE